MKTNLKNFPETPVCVTDEDRIKHFARIISWKIDFEKELREIIKACEEQPIQGKNVRVHLQSRKETCEEILGDV